jgi:hypothetical protein
MAPRNFWIASLLLITAGMPSFPALAQPASPAAGKLTLSSTQRDALTAIYDHGGIPIQLEERPTGRVVSGFDFSRQSDIDDAWVRHLLPFSDVTSLRFSGTAITDSGLADLSRFPHLSELTLSDTPITDAGVSALAKCRQLTRLDVRGTEASADAIAALRAALPNLVVQSSIPRTPLSPQQALSELQRFDGIQITRDENRPGKPVTSIDATTASKLSDESVRLLLDLPELGQFAASGPSLTDAAASLLAGARRLETLSLTGTNLTDAGLVRLAACRQLRTLDITRTRVTRIGIATLRKASPQLVILAEPEKLAATGDLFALRASDKSDAPLLQRFSELQIRLWRERAREISQLPETTPDGWSKCPIDPAKLLTVFPRLKIREGYVLRAYVFKENGNCSGFVWALPADAGFPEPDDCPRLESHVLKPPKPFDALDDVMEVIVGDDSVASYFQASLLRRELKEFGTGWHGVTWGMNMVFDEDPWKSRPDLPQDSLARFPTSDPAAWKWWGAKPISWVPEGQMEAARVIITFYSYTPLAADAPGNEIEKERIYRHTDLYRRGKYRPLVIDRRIAEGPDVIAF